MPKYDIVLFDFDGTVADTDPMIIATMNFLYDKYRGGRRTPVEEIYYFSGPPIKGTLKKEFPDLDQDFIYNEFAKESEKRYKDYVFLFPHVKETLLALKENGVRIGLITNKIRHLTLLSLSLLGIGDVFESIVCFDDVVNPKPHPESMNRAIKELGGSNLSKVLYVGDNNSDYITARNANVDCALVMGGPRALDPTLEPEIWFSSFEELERIILDGKI